MGKTGNEQQPKDDTVVEDETKGRSNNNKDKGVSVMLSDSDVVSGSDSDSDYEGKLFYSMVLSSVDIFRLWFCIWLGCNILGLCFYVSFIFYSKDIS